MKGGIKREDGLSVHYVISLRAAFFEQTQGQTQRGRPSQTDQIKSCFSVGVVIEGLFEVTKVTLKLKGGENGHKLWRSCIRNSAVQKLCLRNVFKPTTRSVCTHRGNLLKLHSGMKTF